MLSNCVCGEHVFAIYSDTIIFCRYFVGYNVLTKK